MSPPPFDFPSLLQPIPGDDPAGSDSPFILHDQLEESRKEVDPADFAPDDPTRPSQPIKVDWAGILRLTRDGLAHTSKSLGRATDWKNIEGGPTVEVGPRTFLVCEDAVTLQEWRQLEITQ